MNETMEERVARIERSVRRWRAVGVAALALAAVALGLRAREPAVPAEIKAQTFSVVDGAGEERAKLTSSPEWGPFLMLHTKNKGEVIVGSVKEDAGLAVLVQGDVRISLLAGSDTTLSFSDGKQTRLLMGLDGKHQDLPGLSFWDEAHQPRLSLGLLAEPQLTVRDAAGKTIASVPPGAGASAPSSPTSPKKK